jgi:hypothetical protein
LITWRDVLDSTQYNDAFIDDLESFYSRYNMVDLGFPRFAHILNLDLLDGMDIGFRFRLISTAARGQEDIINANIYISSVTPMP